MPTDSPGPSTTPSAFRERFRRDREAGRSERLAHDLSLFPDDETLVAKEHLAFETLADPDAAGPGRGSMGPPERIGPYEIRELLDRGGQGQVYRAYDPRMNRMVALKVLARTGPGAESGL